MEECSSALLQRWQRGDESAAEVLFHRYFLRLRALVQGRLSPRLAARLDPDDVVQLAFRSFFTAARGGRFVLRQGDDLWYLLAGITLNKMRHAERRHRAAKRALHLEQLSLPLPGGVNEENDWLAPDPTPEESAMLADEVQALLRALPVGARRIVELRLQGYTLDEIAADVQLCQRTVRRTMDKVRQQVWERLGERDGAAMGDDAPGSRRQARRGGVAVPGLFGRRCLTHRGPAA